MINFIIRYFKNRKKNYSELISTYPRNRYKDFLMSMALDDWQTDDVDILKSKDIYGYTVAHHLAMYNRNWSTNDPEILKLEDQLGNRVAHKLAMYNKNWSTNNPEILELENEDGKTVQDILERRRK